uniref:Uncharacterized protein n=1 Tax=Oryza barthii TaxID=65489 RepID=A0A0D3FR79_9ORYZ
MDQEFHFDPFTGGDFDYPKGESFSGDASSGFSSSGGCPSSCDFDYPDGESFSGGASSGFSSSGSVQLRVRGHPGRVRESFSGGAASGELDYLGSSGCSSSGGDDLHGGCPSSCGEQLRVPGYPAATASFSPAVPQAAGLTTPDPAAALLPPARNFTAIHTATAILSPAAPQATNATSWAGAASLLQAVSDFSFTGIQTATAAASLSPAVTQEATATCWDGAAAILPAANFCKILQPSSSSSMTVLMPMAAD